MSRLTALVPGALCAAALGRQWPGDLDGQIRCIDEGTRSLGLAYCCAPWSPESEDASLRTELGGHADPGAGSPASPAGDLAPGAHRSLESFPAHESRSRAGNDDAVAAGLARMPGAPPVLGLISGPVTWGIRAGYGPALEDAVDAASDLASARIRALAECGVERVVVVESAAAGCVPHTDLVAEAHSPLLRTAEHLRIGLVLVACDLDGVESSGYDRWVSDRGCSNGAGILSRAAFNSRPELEQSLDRLRAVAEPGPEEVITAPLDGSVSPGLVRHAARGLAQAAARP